MNNTDAGYPAFEELVEDQMELRLRAAEAIIHTRPFSFTLSSSQQVVEGRLTGTRSGREGPTSLEIRVTLTDGTRAKLYVPDKSNLEPVTAHFFAYGNPENSAT